MGNEVSGEEQGKEQAINAEQGQTHSRGHLYESQRHDNKTDGSMYSVNMGGGPVGGATSSLAPSTSHAHLPPVTFGTMAANATRRRSSLCSLPISVDNLALIANGNEDIPTVDLSHLSEAERLQIEQVMNRAQKQEQQHIDYIREMSVDFKTVMETSDEDWKPEVPSRPYAEEPTPRHVSISQTQATRETCDGPAIPGRPPLVVSYSRSRDNPETRPTNVVPRRSSPLSSSSSPAAHNHVDADVVPTTSAPVDASIAAWHRRASLGSDYSTSSGESGADATTSTTSSADAKETRCATNTSSLATPPGGGGGEKRPQRGGGRPRRQHGDQISPPEIRTRPDRQPEQPSRHSAQQDQPLYQSQYSPAYGDDDYTSSHAHDYPVNHAPDQRHQNGIDDIPEFIEEPVRAPPTSPPPPSPSPPPPHASTRETPYSDSRLPPATTPATRIQAPASRHHAGASSTHARNSNANNSTSARPRRSDEDDSCDDISDDISDDDDEAEEIDSYDECDDSCPHCGEAGPECGIMTMCVACELYVCEHCGCCNVENTGIEDFLCQECIRKLLPTSARLSLTIEDAPEAVHFRFGQEVVDCEYIQPPPVPHHQPHQQNHHNQQRKPHPVRRTTSCDNSHSLGHRSAPRLGDKPRPLSVDHAFSDHSFSNSAHSFSNSDHSAGQTYNIGHAHSLSDVSPPRPVARFSTANGDAQGDYSGDVVHDYSEESISSLAMRIQREYGKPAGDTTVQDSIALPESPVVQHAFSSNAYDRTQGYADASDYSGGGGGDVGVSDGIGVGVKVGGGGVGLDNLPACEDDAYLNGSSSWSNHADPLEVGRGNADNVDSSNHRNSVHQSHAVDMAGSEKFPMEYKIPNANAAPLNNNHHQQQHHNDATLDGEDVQGPHQQGVPLPVRRGSKVDQTTLVEQGNSDQRNMPTYDHEVVADRVDHSNVQGHCDHGIEGGSISGQTQLTGQGVSDVGEYPSIPAEFATATSLAETIGVYGDMEPDRDVYSSGQPTTRDFNDASDRHPQHVGDARTFGGDEAIGQHGYKNTEPTCTQPYDAYADESSMDLGTNTSRPRDNSRIDQSDNHATTYDNSRSFSNFEDGPTIPGHAFGGDNGKEVDDLYTSIPSTIDHSYTPNIRPEDYEDECPANQVPIATSRYESADASMDMPPFPSYPSTHSPENFVVYEDQIRPDVSYTPDRGRGDLDDGTTGNAEVFDESALFDRDMARRRPPHDSRDVQESCHGVVDGDESGNSFERQSRGNWAEDEEVAMLDRDNSNFGYDSRNDWMDGREIDAELPLPPLLDNECELLNNQSRQPTSSQVEHPQISSHDHRQFDQPSQHQRQQQLPQSITQRHAIEEVRTDNCYQPPDSMEQLCPAPPPPLLPPIKHSTNDPTTAPPIQSRDNPDSVENKDTTDNARDHGESAFIPTVKYIAYDPVKRRNSQDCMKEKLHQLQQLGPGQQVPQLPKAGEQDDIATGTYNDPSPSQYKSMVGEKEEKVGDNTIIDSKTDNKYKGIGDGVNMAKSQLSSKDTSSSNAFPPSTTTSSNIQSGSHHQVTSHPSSQLHHHMTPSQLATLKLLQEDDDEDDDDGGVVVRSQDEDDQFIYQSNFDASNYIERFSRDSATSSRITGDQQLGNIAEENPQIASDRTLAKPTTQSSNRSLYSDRFSGTINTAITMPGQTSTDQMDSARLDNPVEVAIDEESPLDMLESCPSPIEKTRNSTTKSELPRAAFNPKNSSSSLPRSSNKWRDVDTFNDGPAKNEAGEEDLEEEGIWGNKSSIGYGFDGSTPGGEDAGDASISRYEPPKPEVFYQHFTPTLTPTLSPQSSADNPNESPATTSATTTSSTTTSGTYSDPSGGPSALSISNPSPEQVLWNQSLSRSPAVVGDEYVCGNTQQQPPQQPPQPPPQQPYDPKLDAATRHLNEILANKAMMYEQLAREKADNSSQGGHSSSLAASRKISNNVFEPQKPPHSLTAEVPALPIIPCKSSSNDTVQRGSHLHTNASPKHDSTSFDIIENDSAHIDNSLHIVEGSDIGAGVSTSVTNNKSGDAVGMEGVATSRHDLNASILSQKQRTISSSNMFQNIKQLSDSDTPSKLTIDSISRANQNSGGERAKSETTPIVVSSGVLQNARHTGAPATTGIDLHRSVLDGYQGVTSRHSTLDNKSGELGTIDSYTTSSSPVPTSSCLSLPNSSPYTGSRTHESLSTGDLSTATSTTSTPHRSTYTTQYGRGDTTQTMTHPLANSMSHSLGNSMNHTLTNPMSHSMALPGNSLGLRPMTRTASLQDCLCNVRDDDSVEDIRQRTTMDCNQDNSKESDSKSHDWLRNTIAGMEHGKSSSLSKASIDRAKAIANAAVIAEAALGHSSASSPFGHAPSSTNHAPSPLNHAPMPVSTGSPTGKNLTKLSPPRSPSWTRYLVEPRTPPYSPTSRYNAHLPDELPACFDFSEVSPGHAPPTGYTHSGSAPSTSTTPLVSYAGGSSSICSTDESDTNISLESLNLAAFAATVANDTAQLTSLGAEPMKLDSIKPEANNKRLLKQYGADKSLEVNSMEIPTNSSLNIVPAVSNESTTGSSHRVRRKLPPPPSDNTENDLIEREEKETLIRRIKERQEMAKSQNRKPGNRLPAVPTSSVSTTSSIISSSSILSKNTLTPTALKKQINQKRYDFSDKTKGLSNQSVVVKGGVVVPMQVKILKQRLKEEIQITTAGRRLRIDDATEFRQMELDLLMRRKQQSSQGNKPTSSYSANNTMNKSSCFTHRRQISDPSLHSIYQEDLSAVKRDLLRNHYQQPLCTTSTANTSSSNTTSADHQLLSAYNNCLLTAGSSSTAGPTLPSSSSQLSPSHGVDLSHPPPKFINSRGDLVPSLPSVLHQHQHQLRCSPGYDSTLTGGAPADSTLDVLSMESRYSRSAGNPPSLYSNHTDGLDFCMDRDPAYHVSPHQSHGRRQHALTNRHRSREYSYNNSNISKSSELLNIYTGNQRIIPSRSESAIPLMLNQTRRNARFKAIDSGTRKPNDRRIDVENEVRDICFSAGIIKPLSDQMYDDEVMGCTAGAEIGGVIGGGATSIGGGPSMMGGGASIPQHSAPFPMPRRSLNTQRKLYKSESSYDKNSYSSFEYATTRDYDRFYDRPHSVATGYEDSRFAGQRSNAAYDPVNIGYHDNYAATNDGAYDGRAGGMPAYPEMLNNRMMINLKKTDNISDEASLTPISDFGALEMPLLDIKPKSKDGSSLHQNLQLGERLAQGDLAHSPNAMPRTDARNCIVSPSSKLYVNTKTEEDLYAQYSDEDVLIGGETIKLRPISQTRNDSVLMSKYDFPTKRILIAADKLKSNQRGNKTGISIVGGKRISNSDLLTHDRSSSSSNQNTEIGAVITAIGPGTFSDKLHGELQIGDQVLEWNGVALSGMSYEAVKSIVDETPYINGELELVIKSVQRTSVDVHPPQPVNASSFCPLQHSPIHSDYENLGSISDEFDRLSDLCNDIDSRDQGALHLASMNSSLHSDDLMYTASSSSSAEIVKELPKPIKSSLKDMTKKSDKNTAAQNRIAREKEIEESRIKKMRKERQDLKLLEEENGKSERRQHGDPFCSSAIKKSMKTRPQSLGIYGDIQIRLYFDDEESTLNVDLLQACGLDNVCTLAMGNQNMPQAKGMVHAPDSYVKVLLLPPVQGCDQKRRSRYISRSTSPQWKQRLTFLDLHSPLTKRRLEFSVWAYERTRARDRLLGLLNLELKEKNILDNKPHWHRLIAGEPTALPRGAAISHSPPPTSARNSPVPSVQSVNLTTPPLATPPLVTPPSTATPPVSAIKDSSKPTKKVAKVVIKSDKNEKSSKSGKSEKNASKSSSKSSKTDKNSKKDVKKSK